MKLIYKLIPLLMVNIAWANDIIPDHIGDNYVHFAGAATIKSNMPIGTRIIGPLEGQMSTKVHGSCPRNNIRILVRTSDYNSYVDTYNGNKVYATGTPGIGYAINDYQLNTADRDRWFMWGMVRKNTKFVAGQMGAYAGVSFYKTGDIQPDATITNFNMAKFYLRCLNSGPSRLMATLKFVGRLTMKVEQDNNGGSNNGGSNNGGWNKGGQGGNGNNSGSNNGGWNNGGQGGNGNNSGSNNGGWNNGGQGGNNNNSGPNNGGQGGNNNNSGPNNGGQGGNNNNSGPNNGGQGGNSNNSDSNNGGQSGNNNNGDSNNGGQKDNTPNNNNNNNSNSNNSNIWPTH
ncbi:MAG TPA: hypothetical protein ACHBY5_03915 [Arsenophonus apicola]|uniref:hypothetical protein n=1 Tax=Arsenophonus apicola TaxID=2879119 RepID=UPI001CDB5F49|nr:hypothetical protein [Arsenophonus apicola]UBX29658.1 hypothetical protein LDL57_02985 [Arsenophonus apicola]